MADTGEKSYIAKESTLQTVLTKLDTMSTKSDMTTLQNSVTSALSGVGGAVKSVQRGIKLNNKSVYYTDVTISAVNTNKSMVNVTCNGYMHVYTTDTLTLSSTNLNTATNSSAAIMVDAVLVNSTTLRLVHSNHSKQNTWFFWEVVEFN